MQINLSTCLWITMSFLPVILFSAFNINVKRGISITQRDKTRLSTLLCTGLEWLEYVMRITSLKAGKSSSRSWMIFGGEEWVMLATSTSHSCCLVTFCIVVMMSCNKLVVVDRFITVLWPVFHIKTWQKYPKAVQTFWPVPYQLRQGLVLSTGKHLANISCILRKTHVQNKNQKNLKCLES